MLTLCGIFYAEKNLSGSKGQKKKIFFQRLSEPHFRRVARFHEKKIFFFR
jgi:hypothetical protein